MMDATLPCGISGRPMKHTKLGRKKLQDTVVAERQMCQGILNPPRSQSACLAERSGTEATQGRKVRCSKQ